VLVRIERLDTSDQGTFGRLTAGGLTLFTGELPDRNNAPNVSCIPAGNYQCLWTFSPTFKRFMYAVVPVTGRSGIRVHPANYMGENPPWRKQLHGCIALGEKLGWMDKQKAVLLSAPAVTKLENTLERQPFTLEIINAWAS